MPHFETSRAVLQTWRAVYVRLLRQNHLSPTGLTINFLAYKYQAAAEEDSLNIKRTMFPHLKQGHGKLDLSQTILLEIIKS